jgi:hypothetical protein
MELALAWLLCVLLLSWIGFLVFNCLSSWFWTSSIVSNYLQSCFFFWFYYLLIWVTCGMLCCTYLPVELVLTWLWIWLPVELSAVLIYLWNWFWPGSGSGNLWICLMYLFTCGTGSDLALDLVTCGRVCCTYLPVELVLTWLWIWLPVEGSAVLIYLWNWFWPGSRSGYLWNCLLYLFTCGTGSDQALLYPALFAFTWSSKDGFR